MKTKQAERPEARTVTLSTVQKPENVSGEAKIQTTPSSIDLHSSGSGSESLNLLREKIQALLDSNLELMKQIASLRQEVGLKKKAGNF